MAKLIEQGTFTKFGDLKGKEKLSFNRKTIPGDVWARPKTYFGKKSHTQIQEILSPELK